MKRLFAALMASICLASGVWAATVDLSTLSGSKTLADGDVAKGVLNGNRKISIAAGARVTLSGASINAAGATSDSNKFAGLTCLGDATITLVGDNIVKGFNLDYPAIYVPLGSTLTIKGTGALYAFGGSRAAGIGGGYNIDCGSIVINGGKITANAGYNSAGIGGGVCDRYYPDRYVAFGDITINDGTVTATGGPAGAGIGGGLGHRRTGGTIRINGGKVVAEGGTGGAGIGSGANVGAVCSAHFGEIYITGGDVTANGNGAAAGIGSGANSTCRGVVISGGTVNATGGAATTFDSGAGIGCGGKGASCGSIEITGGVVVAKGGQYTAAHPGAGIGTGYAGSCGRIMISGGDVTAYGYTTGLSSSVGIGVSAGGDCAGIKITGGDVKANGGDQAAGIGWGWNGGETGDIVINPKSALKVVATCGENMSAPIAKNGEGTSLEISAGLTDKTSGRTRILEWNGELDYIEHDIVVGNKQVLSGTAYGSWKLAIADGATVTISNVTINGANNNSCNWAGITCLGDATIVLKGNNSVKGFYQDYPGIYVPYGKKLVIEGDGSLAASSNGRGAGIGGGYQIDCGVIEVKGGSITATGGSQAAGIGGGYKGYCGNIFIRSGITSVIATRGTGSAKPIGNGEGEDIVNPVVASGLDDKTSESGKARYITKGTVVERRGRS